MKKFGRMALVIGILFTFSLFSATTIFTAETGPDTITFTSKKKPTKEFNHAMHSKAVETCSECHHSGNVTDKCLDCHNIDNVDVGKITSVKKVFHGNCIPCHKEMAKELGKRSKCSDCHLKKKRRMVLEGC